MSKVLTFLDCAHSIVAPPTFQIFLRPTKHCDQCAVCAMFTPSYGSIWKYGSEAAGSGAGATTEQLDDMLLLLLKGFEESGTAVVADGNCINCW